MELSADPLWRQGNLVPHDTKYTVGRVSHSVSEGSQIVSEKKEAF